MDSGEVKTSRARRWWIAAVMAVAIIAVAAVGWYALTPHDSPQDSMTAQAEQVMPFDLNATTHTFTKTDTGGVQQIVVKDPANTRNLALIRSHLAKEAASFRAGNYSDPARIHGMDMPGMKELEAGAARVTVTYADIPGGAQITYSSTEPALISAIHSWFDRQTADHSMPGTGG